LAPDMAYSLNGFRGRASNTARKNEQARHAASGNEAADQAA